MKGELNDPKNERTLHAEYKRDMKNNYLVLFEEEGECVEEYQLKMISVNTIKGLLQCGIRVMDNRRSYYYEITSRQPFCELFRKRPICYSHLQSLFVGIRDALEYVNDYLLLPDCLVLEPEYIYVDIETLEPGLLYFPPYKRSIRESFRSLAEYILDHLDQKDNKAVMAGYEIYKCSAQENISIVHIMEKLFPKEPASDANASRSEDMLYTVPKPSVEREERLEPKADVKYQKKESQAERRHQYKREETSTKGVESWIVKALIAGAVLIFLVIVIYGLWFFQILSLTQIGGIFFLLVIILAYILSASRSTKQVKEKKNQKAAKDQRSIAENKVEKTGKYIGHKRTGDRVSGYKPPKIYEEPPDICADDRKQEEVKVKVKTYGLTEYLGEEEEQSSQALLKSLLPTLYPDILLDKEVIYIGKVPDMADVILASSTISRIHGKIQHEDGMLYITDLNSTNGIYINGEVVAPNERRKLYLGDEIRFADIGFVFTEIGA